MRGSLLLVLLFLPQVIISSNVCPSEFKLLDKLIVVEASVDDQTGYFILDTGAPDLVLNSSYFDIDQQHHQAIGISNAIPAGETKIKNFTWGCIQLKKITPAVLNLTHLERATGEKILGLIGYTVLCKKEILIDYDQKVILQYPFKRSLIEQEQQLKKSIPFKLNEHFLIIEVEMGQQVLQLVLDTGSEDNILHSPIGADYEVCGSKMLAGIDRQYQKVAMVAVPFTQFRTISFRNIQFLLKDFNLFYQNIDGVVGFPLLSGFRKFSINYRKKSVYLWD